MGRIRARRESNVVEVGARWCLERDGGGREGASFEVLNYLTISLLTFQSQATFRHSRPVGQSRAHESMRD